MMPKLDLRPATIQDLDRIMDLESTGFDPGVREKRDVYEQRIVTFAEGALVAELESKIVGCIFSEIWSRIETLTASDFELGHDIDASHQADGEWIYISSMTIDPCVRGQGLGHQLFNGCIDFLLSRFRQVNQVILLVNETWTHARTIYEKSGFQTILVLPGFFVPFPEVRQDGIVMTKSLSTPPPARAEQ